MASLRHTIETVPVPGAPPRLSRSGAAVGLALLDTALRLNHVRRLTERLKVVEHGTARRTTEIDISLPLLDEGQRYAMSRIPELISEDRGDRTESADHRPTLWVPVARLPRESVSPVDVYDGTGHKLARITQHETSRLIACGLYRLLRGILASHEDAQSPGTDLSIFLHKVHEPRWLLQQALLTLLTERSSPVREYSFDPTPDTMPGHVRKCREFALDLLEAYREPLVEYTKLLDIAVREYLLVVGLDDRVDEHLLTYETPLYVRDKPGPVVGTLRRFAAARRGYLVEYEAEFPLTLKSYHLVAETSPEMHVAHMYLSTNADETPVTRLSTDLTTLADRWESTRRDGTGAATHKIIELQAQTVLRHLAGLLRRRKWEAGQAGIALPDAVLPACHRLAAAASTGEARRTSGNNLDNSLLRHSNFTVANLRAAAGELTESELARDLVLVKKVPDREPHVYWRRSGVTSEIGRARLRAGLVLADATEGGPSSMAGYAAMVAATVYLLACLMTRSPLPFGPDATAALGSIADGQSVITVLLLVPGFLYTRLALPPRRSIAGYLRTLSIAVGQLCILCTAALAATIATRGSGPVVQVFVTIGVVVPLLSIALLLRPRRRQSRFAFTRIGAPRWAAGDTRPTGKQLTPDVRYYTAGDRP